MVNDYINSLEKLFVSHADANNAFSMKKYMKDKFDFLGLRSNGRRELQKEFLKTNGFPPDEFMEPVARALWEKPHREYQYFALDILDKKSKKQEKENIVLIEYLITSKSWWDTVDLIATKLAGTYFMKFPGETVKATEKWMDSGNMWLQRVSLLYQLKYKNETDTDLLAKYIRRLSGSDEFFIRKAIGWVLREYSKTDPRFVLDFVENNDISIFSKKEALKWLQKK